MLDKKNYNNRQKTHELRDEGLIFFYKSGQRKAEGSYVNGQIDVEWKFYRETGQLSQVGIFNKEVKHGPWVRYNKDNQVEYQETFTDGKVLK